MEKPNYPKIQGKKPIQKLQDSSEIDGPETTTKRAIYKLDPNTFVTIKPVYDAVSTPSQTNLVQWSILTGTDKSCQGESIGPFETVEKAVNYIEESIV